MKRLATLFTLCVIMSLTAITSCGSTTSTGSKNTQRISISKETITLNGKMYHVHKVQKNQSIKLISWAYNVSPESIYAQNAWARGGVKPNQTLYVPTLETYRKWLRTKEGRESENDTENYDDNSQTDHTTKKEKGDSTPPPPHEKDVKDTDNADYEDDREDYGDAPMLRRFDTSEPINVRILLPLSNTIGAREEMYKKFINGVLLAADSLKNAGISTNIKFISYEESRPQSAQTSEDDQSSDDETANTAENTTDYSDNNSRGRGLFGTTRDRVIPQGDSLEEREARRIITSGELDDAHIIIGPVYSHSIAPFVSWAEHKRIPIVSPLATIDNIQSPYVYQAAPCESIKYEKLNEMFEGKDINVIVFKDSNHLNAELYNELRAFTNNFNIKEVENANRLRTPTMRPYLDKTRKNIIILPTTRGTAASSVMEKISLLAQTGTFDITLIGQSEWFKQNIRTDLLFKLNTHIITNYHEDRISEKTARFYTKYINTYTSIPTKVSMRGYDVTIMFVEALKKWGPAMPLHISGEHPRPLQIPYSFEQDGAGSSFINSEWPIVRFNQDYTIDII